ncbi:MAG: ribonuclease P protein component [Acidimicrobiia bacterium]|nr:ribonuclease P protein component [Acidimicrobiia bacterium]
MIWRIRDHATFQDLARARRWRRGPVAVRFLAVGSTGPPQVAYAVGRRVGGAVARNRARRRLRAAIRACRDQLVPGGAYLVSAGAPVVTMPFGTLVDALSDCLAAAERGSR